MLPSCLRLTQTIAQTHFKQFNVASTQSSPLLLYVTTARPWLSNWPLHTYLQQCLIDSAWTVSGFPSPNARCECFSIVLLFKQLSATTSFSTNNILGSLQSPWLVLLLPHRLNALCCHLFCSSRNQASWKYWYAAHICHVLLGSFAQWILDRDLLPASAP